MHHFFEDSARIVGALERILELRVYLLLSDPLLVNHVIEVASGEHRVLLKQSGIGQCRLDLVN